MSELPHLRDLLGQADSEAIVNVIGHTCAFPSLTSQIVCLERGSRLRHDRTVFFHFYPVPTV